MDEGKVNNAVLGIMFAMKGYELTPTEEISVLGRLTSSYARTIDTMYSFEMKPDEEIVDSMLKSLDEIMGSSR